MTIISKIIKKIKKPIVNNDKALSDQPIQQDKWLEKQHYVIGGCGRGGIRASIKSEDKECDPDLD